MIIHIQLKDKQQSITSPRDVCHILNTILASEDAVDRDREHLWVILLDARNKIKLLELVSLGTLNDALVHPREVFTRAVGIRCYGIILAHNHPSGDPLPSDNDIKISQRLAKAGAILDIKLVDHVIVGKERYTSLREEGII